MHGDFQMGNQFTVEKLRNQVIYSNGTIAFNMHKGCTKEVRYYRRKATQRIQPVNPTSAR